MTRVEFEALCKKAYHPSNLTNKELAQLRRSSRVGSNLLSKVKAEQEKRGLLNDGGKEIVARIADYED